MRVCLASNLYPPDVIGGAEMMVGHLARGLRRADCDVTVVTSAPRSRAGSETVEGITVHRIPTGNLYWPGDAARQPRALKPLWHTIDLWNPFVYRRVRQLLGSEKFDVVHTNNLGGLSPAVWSAVAASRTPIVHTPHDYALTCVRSTRMMPDGRTCWTPCVPCAVRGLWLRRLSALVDGVIAPSRFVLDRHHELGFFPRARATIVPWGVPLPPPSAPQTTSGADVRFLYMGHLARHKGVAVLLDAFSRVRQKQARLEIAGAGPLSGECAAAAARDPRITFHGFVSGEEKDALLRSCQVLLVPSICWETAGLVVLEAFAHGLPVVAARSGGVPELVDEGVTGFLVDRGDSPALAERIETLAIDSALIARLSPQCRTFAGRRTLDQTVNGVLDVYGEMRRP